jgi:hypothetical protein
MNGSYLASRVRRLRGPIIAFREYAFRDVIPAFGDLDARAEQVANEYYNRIWSQPAGEYEIDMADVAEDARQHSHDWWEMMTSLRQTMLNLIAAGLFHLVEQQLATLTRDGLFDGPVRDTKLSIVAEWYKEHLGTTLAEMPSWNTIDEMRLVANTVKHGEGSSAHHLRAVNPALFNDPAYAELLRSEGLDMDERLTRDSLAAPLSGEDFFVTEEVLHGYAVRAAAFFDEIAADLFRRE